MKKILSIVLLLLMVLLMFSCGKNEAGAREKYADGVLQYVKLPDYRGYKIKVNMDAVQMSIDNYLLQTAKEYTADNGDNVYIDIESVYRVKEIETDEGTPIDVKGEELTELEKKNVLIENLGAGSYWQNLEFSLMGLSIGDSFEMKDTIPSNFEIEEYRNTEVFIKFTFKNMKVRRGDVADVEYTGYYIDENDKIVYEEGEKKSFDSGKSSFYLGSHLAIDDFEDGILGMEVGEKKEFFATFPEDYGVEDLNGKKVLFECTLKGIRKPAIYNDDFAKEYYGYDTIEELEAHLIESEWQNSSLTNIIDNIVVNTYPLSEYIRMTIEITKEAKEFKDQYFSSYGITFDDYLSMYMGMTRSEYIKLQMKTEMVYYAIAEKENIKVKSEEIVERKKELIDEYKNIYMSNYGLDEQSALIAGTRYVNEHLGDYGVEEMILFEKVREHIYENAEPEIVPRTYDSVTLEKAKKYN